MDLTTAEHPESVLAEEQLDALRETPSLAIAEIAGRDSLAAVVRAVEQRGFTTLLPTVVCVGTEYGDLKAPERAVFALAERLPNVEILAPLWFSSPKLWAALNGRFAAVVAERFGVSSACLACHLYMHLCRLPLARTLGGVPVIAGERDTHDGRIKLSQTHASIDAAIEVLEYAGVELLEPIRDASSDDVEALVGEQWKRYGSQTACLLSGNYVGLGGEVAFDGAAHRWYSREFLVPAGMAIIDAWRATPDPDYEEIVREVLGR